MKLGLRFDFWSSFPHVLVSPESAALLFTMADSHPEHNEIALDIASSLSP